MQHILGNLTDTLLHPYAYAAAINKKYLPSKGMHALGSRVTKVKDYRVPTTSFADAEACVSSVDASGRTFSTLGQRLRF